MDDEIKDDDLNLGDNLDGDLEVPKKKPLGEDEVEEDVESLDALEEEELDDDEDEEGDAM